MAVATHVMQYSSGNTLMFSSYADITKFSRVLHGFDGTDQFSLLLWALGPGMDYEQSVAAGLNREYIQAAGREHAMTVEICRAGGQEWGADWVRYVVGHRQQSETALDVPIALPYSTEMRSLSEIFEADEAAQLFFDFYKTGDIPAGYTLRPEQGFARGGGDIDLRDKTLRSQ